MNEWLKFAPKASALPQGKTYHVFLSYRSVHRPWVLQLYDILKDLEFEVYLDQYVLKANDDLVLALQKGLDESASGILIWSSKTEDSVWCEKEYSTMEHKATGGDFHYGVAKLDKANLPAFASNKLYADFSDYSEGPTGLGLLRLLYNIIDKPLPDDAIRFGTKVDEEYYKAFNKIEAAKDIGNINQLSILSKTDSTAWNSTPVLKCAVANAIIKLGENDAAIEVLKNTETQFPRAKRPKQLKGLALARKGKTDEAQLILGELEAAGNLDPETMGILARTWMDRYNDTGKEAFLRKSRNLYELGCTHSPSDYYVCINAASKSVFLGEYDKALEIADKVEGIVGKEVAVNDYWKTATAAEVQLIKKEFILAGQLYQAGVDMDPMDVGSHQSTRKQARLLLDHLNASDEDREKIELAFKGIPE